MMQYRILTYNDAEMLETEINGLACEGYTLKSLRESGRHDAFYVAVMERQGLPICSCDKPAPDPVAYLTDTDKQYQEYRQELRDTTSTAALQQQTHRPLSATGAIHRRVTPCR